MKNEKTVPISIRFPKSKLEKIEEVARLRNQDRTDFIREGAYKLLADLGFLSEDEKKAWGIGN